MPWWLPEQLRQSHLKISLKAKFITLVVLANMYNMGQYIPGESIIHRLDPRVKIVSVIGLSIITLKGEAFTWGMISTFLIVLVPASRLAPHHILKALSPMVDFFLLLFLFHLIFTDGTPIAPFPQWCVTIPYYRL